ncbi:DUF5675 family protein [Algoriphagus halophytocola]|uniref:DUF5675 family protein n=1 Tax=Algoriphagus halophytocola TaxID=2991499 RepID=UPI0022DCF356|nr:DUF5675 family protein [Algoriphagus sp. TR-M9]WBL42391.1 DUF5675 family protein [Algoriphagus sp. TR-M9]
MEKRILIQRVKKNQDCTIGNLSVNGVFVCHTLELPWRNNEPRRSCIPAGQYEVVYREDPRSNYKYRHLHVLNVPGRSWILFHKGNYPKDTLGCILPGLSHTDSMVGESSMAFRKLMLTLEGGTSISLEILP